METALLKVASSTTADRYVLKRRIIQMYISDDQRIELPLVMKH